jgi:hypothetical protein
MGRLTTHFDYCKLFECGFRNEELAKKNQCDFFTATSMDTCHEKAVYEKLREYEDLEEQVLKSTGTDLASMVGEFMYYYNLKKENRLLELPCKVGDTVYRVNQYAKEPIISMRISRIELVESLGGYSNFSIETINKEDKGEAYYYKREIGKVVFLTKSEAEKALAEMEKKDE